MFEAHCEEVIITDLTQRGKGIEGDPIRRILQVWRKDGTLIAEKDEWLEAHKIKEELWHNKLQ